MEIIRKELAPAIVYDFPTRYVEEDDVVEMSPDGGATWQPFPEGDPRRNNHTAPPDTANPRCDAAERISVATRETYTYIIDEIDLSATVLTLVQGFFRLATPIFTYIPYLSFTYTVMNAILAIGSVALHSAFDAFDWDEFTCVLYRRVRSDGRIDSTGFELLLADIAAKYDGTVEFVLYQLYANIGFGGLNDQAGIRTDTGDCAACGTFNYGEDFTGGLQVGTTLGFDGVHNPIAPYNPTPITLINNPCRSPFNMAGYARIVAFNQNVCMVTIDLGQNINITELRLQSFAGVSAHSRGIYLYQENNMITAQIPYNTVYPGGSGCLPIGNNADVVIGMAGLARYIVVYYIVGYNQPVGLSQIIISGTYP